MDFHIITQRDGRVTGQHVESAGHTLEIHYKTGGYDIRILLSKVKVESIIRPTGNEDQSTWSHTIVPLEPGRYVGTITEAGVNKIN